MTRPEPKVRIAGWLLAGAAAVGLVGGATAFALAAERRPSVLVLDLGTRPPAALAIAAISEAAPDVAAADPSLPQPLDQADALPVLPDATPRPIDPAAARIALPEIEPRVTADLSLPPLETDPNARPEPTLRPKARPAPKPEAKAKREEPRADEPERAEQPASSASAPGAAAKAEGGGVSPAAYAKAVLKKVRATKRKTVSGRGTVVVGFTIAPNGGVASVQVLQSSGDAGLDAIAVDHIRRSAPFPAPPPSAKPGYSFEFVGG